MLDLSKRNGRTSGACEMNPDLDRACLFNALTPLPLLQSWRKGPRERLTKMSFVSQASRTQPGHEEGQGVRQRHHV